MLIPPYLYITRESAVSLRGGQRPDEHPGGSLSQAHPVQDAHQRRTVLNVDHVGKGARDVPHVRRRPIIWSDLKTFVECIPSIPIYSANREEVPTAIRPIQSERTWAGTDVVVESDGVQDCFVVVISLRSCDSNAEIAHALSSCSG